MDFLSSLLSSRSSCTSCSGGVPHTGSPVQEGATAASAADSSSPVSWYLLVWILFTLAANSMAQPSGRVCGASVRYRVYLCSSPLFAFSDGLSILIRVILASFILQISPLKASRMAIITRADERHHTFRNKDSCFDDRFPGSVEQEDPIPPSSTNIPTWPRWLFFTIGTMPAAVQLASFQGVPGTQTLGIMFMSSFVVIELIACLASFEEEKNDIPSLLGYMKVSNVTIEEQDFRYKVFRLIRRLEWFDWIIFILTFFANLIFMFNLLQPILAPLHVPISKALHDIIFLAVGYFILGAIVMALTVLLIIRCILIFFGPWPFLDRHMSLGRLFWTFAICDCLYVSIPYQSPFEVDFRDRIIAAFVSCLWLKLLHSVLLKICTRSPIVGRVLLIDRRPWDKAKVEHLPERERNGIELGTEVIHPWAWICFCVFLGNLSICIWWYKIVYNPTGTINPSWTYVFG